MPNITADQLHPVMLIVYHYGDGYLKQDNAFFRGGRYVQDWCQDHERTVYFDLVSTAISRFQSH